MRKEGGMWEEALQSLKLSNVVTSKVPAFDDNSEGLSSSCSVSININLGLLNAFHVLAEPKERRQAS